MKRAVSHGNVQDQLKRRLLRFAQRGRSRRCPNCQDEGVIISDTSEGTQICNQCGLVVESSMISDEAEWRNFSNDGSTKQADRNRASDITDVWLDGHLTGTTFIKSNKKLQQLSIMTQVNRGDQALISAFGVLKVICETFSLRSNVSERAKEITKELMGIEQLKNKTGSLCMLAIVYLACREAGHVKSIKELITFDRSFKEKDLGRMINKIKKLLPNRTFVYNDNISHVIFSLSNRLQLSSDLIDDIEHVVKTASTLITTSHRLNSLCGGSIYLVVELSLLANGERFSLPTLAQIATVCGVTANTLKTTFKELLNASDYILPPKYLQQRDALVQLRQKYLTEERRKKREQELLMRQEQKQKQKEEETKEREIKDEREKEREKETGGQTMKHEPNSVQLKLEPTRNEIEKDLNIHTSKIKQEPVEEISRTNISISIEESGKREKVQMDPTCVSLC